MIYLDSSPLQNKDYIVDRIVQETGMSREELEKRIEEKIAAYSGLLTEAGAAFSIAKELGVDVDLPVLKEEYTDIGDIKEDLGFVNVTGIVKAVSNIREWKKDDREGKLVRLLLVDKTGEIWVILWNDDAELVEKGKIKIGTILGIKNAMVKTRLNGKLELNIGMRSRIIIDPKVDKEFPQVGETSSISDISEGKATVYGKVMEKYQKREFESNGRSGKVSSLLISDGSKVRVVLWGDQADLIDSIKLGDTIKVENGTVKRVNDKYEIHVNWDSRVLINPDDAPDLTGVVIETKRTHINELKPGETAEIRGTVVNVFPPTIIKICPVCGRVVEDVCPEHGKSKKTIILNIEIDDGTGVIRGVLFRDMAERFLGINDVESDNIDEKVSSALGKELIFYGNVEENKVFERLEMRIRRFEEPDLNQEIQIIRG